MHRYEILERRWKRYRLKKWLKLLLIPSALIGLAAGGYYLYQPQIITRAKTLSMKQDNLLLPQKDFEKRLTYKKSPYKKPNRKSKKRVKEREKTTEQPLFISNKKADIKELEKSYRSYPTYSKAIYLAKIYYDKKEYKKSLAWSLKANEMNKEDERSWIIFAKNLIKLNQKEKAARVLKTYIINHNSEKAKKLLTQIYKERGK